MSKPEACPECGGPVAAGSIRGLCTSCLVKLGGGLLGLARKPVAEPSGAAFPLVRCIGDYEIIEEIARGGMGVVYKARQRGLNRIVALKRVLDGPFSRLESRERFRAEAEAAASLRHPNIVAIYEIGEDNGQPFFSMDYVAGRTLADLVRAQPLPAQAAARYAQVIAEAIHFAHGHGILHRDLKPSNVLIDEFDQPRITDFGLAKRVSVDSELTLTGQMLGSPNFMAPEQVAGKRRVVGPATDVHGLGGILYQMLTGRPPFVAETLSETLQQVSTVDPISPRLLNPSAPRDLETICLKCLEKEPAQRYVGAGMLANDLQRWREGKPIQARPVSAPEKVGKWVRRHPAVSGLATGLVVIAVVGFISVLWQRNRAVANAEETRQLLVRSHVERGLELVGRQEAMDALPYLAEAMKVDRERGRPEMEAGHRTRLGLALRPLPKLLHYLPHERPVMAVEFSPNGRRLATVTEDNLVRVWDVSDGTVTLRLKEQMPDSDARKDQGIHQFARFSPDGGRILATTGRDAVRVWDARTGEPLTPLMTHAGKVAQAVFSPDGRWVGTAAHDRTARVWNTATGQPITGPLEHEEIVNVVAFDPTGRLLATGTATFACAAIVWDVQRGEKAFVAQEGYQAYTVQFSPDGRSLLTTSRDGLARILDLESKKQRIAIPHGTDVWVGAFSPDGKKFVTGSDAHQARVWDSMTGQPVTGWLPHDGAVTFAAFSPDGQLVVTASWDQTARIWSVSDKGPFCPPLRHAGMVNSASISLDGTLIATAGMDYAARIWSLPHETEEKTFYQASLGHPVNHVAFSPDGGRVAIVDSNKGGHIWNLVSREPIGQDFCQVLGWNIYTVEFSPDGQLVATAGDDGTAHIFAGWSGKEQKSLAHGSSIFVAHFSPDGTKLLTACADGRARLWSPADGKILSELAHSNAVINAEFSRDGRRIVTASFDRTARVWDVATGRPAGPPLRHKSEVYAAVFSPDGLRVVTASFDHTAQVWDPSSGEKLLPPLKHAERLSAVAYSPDGSRILTGSFDRTARQWDARTGAQIGPALLHGNVIQSLNFSPDGRHFVIATLDAPARVWDADTSLALSPPLHDRLVYATFSPDGNRVATCGKDATARIWDFRPETRSAEYLLDLAQVLAGHRFDSSGNIVQISPEEVNRIWQRLKASYPSEFAQSPTAVVSWHKQFALTSERRRDYFAALFHLDELIKLAPDDQELVARRDRIRELMHAL